MPSPDVMRNGYRQNTLGFGKLLRQSKPLDRVLRLQGVQIAWYFRNNAARSRGAGPHSADQIHVVKRTPGGRRKDRMEMLVVAYDQKNPRDASETLREGLVAVSGGRKLSRRGRLSA